jgi:hypothetical protein
MTAIQLGQVENPLNFCQMLQALQAQGIDVKQPAKVPADIRAKWEACIAGIHNLIFTNEVGDISTMAAPFPIDVNIAHSRTLDAFLKEVEKIMAELSEYPDLKVSIAQSLAHLVNETFFYHSDSTTHAYEVPHLIARAIPAEQALPILFWIWTQKGCYSDSHMMDATSEEMSQLIASLPKESTEYQKFLWQFVDSKAFDHPRGKTKMVDGNIVGLDILPHLGRFLENHLADEYVNNRWAVLNYVNCLARFYADGKNVADSKKTLDFFLEISRKIKPFKWQLFNLPSSLAKVRLRKWFEVEMSKISS